MFAQINYYCPQCSESKLARIGDRSLPTESLRFQIELKGFNCPSCGCHIKGVIPESYKILEE